MAQKYDRQLRLWTSSGQDLISSSRVLALGTSLSQCELLKNLILGGVGHFTLLGEDTTIAVEHIENNFYLEDEDFGKPLVGTLAARLNELNSDVQHDVVTVRSGGIAQAVGPKVRDYDLIVSDSPFPLTLHSTDPPVLEIQSKSYYSLIHVRFEEMCVVDSHLSIADDLKLLKPWPELVEYFESFELESLGADELSNVPFPVILYQLSRRWAAENGQLPQRKELAVFRKGINALCPRENLLNLEEASRNAHTITLKTVPEGFGVLDSLVSRINELPSQFGTFRGSYNDKFWVLAFVLNEYVAQTGQLPVSGSLPDMDSDTLNYLKLKEIYQQKFQDDLFVFKQLLQDTINEFDINFRIEEEMIVKFVKNCRILNHSTSKNAPLSLSTIAQPVENKYKLIAYAFTLLDTISNTAVLSNFDIILSKSGELKDNKDFQSILYEILRSDGQELLNIASISGGIGAQEALKLLMRQYVALDGTWVFDGTDCTSDRFKSY